MDVFIVEYWLEFVCNGKENVFVGMMFDYFVGVLVVCDFIGDVINWDVMVECMVVEEVFWELGIWNGYYGFIYSWIIGEIICRVLGMSVGVFF